MSDIHPYTPYKVFCHHKNWEQVYRWSWACEHSMPAPITVSVDPSSSCQMACIGCNAAKVIEENQTRLDKEYLEKLAKALGKWGVKGACLGGGGESLTNSYTPYFIYKLQENGVKSGMVTNGLLANQLLNSAIEWVGVSVDAGTKNVWANVHGINKKLFDQVIGNMSRLIENGIDTTYKYLIRPENVYDIFEAVKLAKEIGCKSFHIRPMASPWFTERKPLFTLPEREAAFEQLETAKQKFGDDIDIIGVFSKLNPEWKIDHPFKKCWAIFATCVFQSNKKVGLCCDLRGCPTVEVGPFDNPEDFIYGFWGTPQHKAVQDSIDVTKCSRCTFSMLNQYFEKAIIHDGLMTDFI